MSDHLNKYLIITDFLSEVRFSLNQENQVLLDASEEQIQLLLMSLGLKKDVYNYFTKSSCKDFQFALTENNFSGFKIYDSKEKFLNRITALKNDQNFIIYDSNNKFYLGYVEGSTFEGKVSKGENYFFENLFLFKEFLDLWEKMGIDANTSNNSFRFIDYYNEQSQIFLLSNLDKRAEIKKSNSFIDLKKDLSENLRLFKNSFDNESKNQFPFFLKKELIEESSKYDGEDVLINLFTNFQKVHNRAHLNFQVYIHDISIEKLKGEYEDFKKDYLEAFSEVTSKLLIKILSIPVAFGASVFALSKITSQYLIIILLLGIMATSVIINLSLNYHFLDLKAISKVLIRKVQQIKEHAFFLKNPQEKEELNEIIHHIKSKINLAIQYIWYYFSLTTVIVLLLLIYPIKNELIEYFPVLPELENINFVSLSIGGLIICYILYGLIESLIILYRTINTLKLKKRINLN